MVVLHNDLAFDIVRVYTRTMSSSSACYCLVLRNASRRVTSLYDEALAPLGINISQFSQLRNIRKVQPVSLTDLAQRLQLDRSTVGRNTKILERMGLVAAGPGEDQRENVLSLTQKGEDMVEQGAPIWDDVQRRMEEKLGPAGMDQLVAALRTL